jgi:hypothetical protein
VLVELQIPAEAMSPGAALTVVAGALKNTVSVNPWLAALWLAAAFALAGLLVYTWRRLVPPI